MKSILLAATLLGVLGCGANITGVDPDPIDKTACQGVTVDGIATFQMFQNDPDTLGQVDVIITWTKSDGTVADANTYKLYMSQQCVADENLTVGSQTAVHGWVQCPKSTKAHAAALDPFDFTFPNLTASSCHIQF